MNELAKPELNPVEKSDFKFTLSEKERQNLMREIEEMKKRLRMILANRKSKKDPALANLEILDVEVKHLGEKELCLFRLYRALRDSGDANAEDWQKILLAITDHREQTRARQQEDAQEQKTFCDSKEMSMQDEFLAWLYNLAYGEYGKLRKQEKEEKREAA